MQNAKNTDLLHHLPKGKSRSPYGPIFSYKTQKSDSRGTWIAEKVKRSSGKYPLETELNLDRNSLPNPVKLSPAQVRLGQNFLELLDFWPVISDQPLLKSPILPEGNLCRFVIPDPQKTT